MNMKIFHISKFWNGESYKPANQTNTNSIRLGMKIHTSGRALELVIEALFFQNSTIPQQTCSGRCPKLYEHEVVEVFIASATTHNKSQHQVDYSATPYLEVIVGPFGHYLIISHTGQGNWSECNDQIILTNPEPWIQISDDRTMWKARLMIPYELLPEVCM